MSQFDSSLIHPNCVKFVKVLYENFRRRDIFRLEDLYTYDWHQLTESYFKNSPWPTWDEVRSVLEDEPEDGEPFIHVYQELYFRHLFDRCQPTVEDMFDSFGNYLQLMNAILSLDVCAPDFELPPTWLWDVLESFVLQFNRFHNFRHSAQNLDPDSLQLLRDHEHVWSAQTMTRYLQVLVKKSGIDHDMTPDKYLQMLEQQKEADPQPSIFFRFLGQFSSVGLLVTHCLLGDYYSALEALRLFDINSRQNTWFEVLDVYACIAYHVGWANMMLRRYTEAVRTITQFLQVVGLDPNNRVHLGPQAKVHVSRMHGVLRLCQALVPRQKIDDSIGGAVSDVVNETLEAYAAASGADPRSLTDPQVVAIVFSSLGPEFVDTTTPKFLRSAEEGEGDAEGVGSSDPAKAEASEEEGEEDSSESGLAEVPGLLESAPQKLQRKIFTKELESRRVLESAETCLRLCTTVSTTELAKFLQTTEDEVERLLVALKHKRFEKIREEWLERNSTIRFHVENEMVHVVEQAYRRRDHKPFFSRHIMNLENLMARVRSIGTPRM